MPQTMHLYRMLATYTDALCRCQGRAHTASGPQGAGETEGAHWDAMAAAHAKTLRDLCAQYLPHGSGFDSGVKIAPGKSTPEKIVLEFDFHHMNADGFYTCWTSHTAIITGSLLYGFTLRVTGPSMNGAREEFAEYISEALEAEVTV